MTKKDIKEELEELKEELNKQTEKSRNLSIAITKVDEAIMWLNRDVESF